MLKLKVELRQVIAPLIYEALRTSLNSFAEEHWREADRNNLTSITFRRRVAELAAAHFAQRKGLVKWRGVINQDTAKQLLVEITRLRLSLYRSHAKTTSIYTQDITRLAQQRRNTRRP
jgi:hypothetical protein